MDGGKLIFWCIFYNILICTFSALFGDIGSGYWIGSEILRIVAGSRDGVNSKTVLDTLLQNHIGKETDLLTWVYQNNDSSVTWKKFADLAPLVFKAYEQNDEGITLLYFFL